MDNNRMSAYKAASAIALAVICTVLWARNFYQDHQTETPGTVVVATPSKEVRDVPKVSAPVRPGVKVHKGGAALKGGLNLPPDAIAAPNIEVLESNTIKGGDHPKTVTTVIDTETGESKTYVRTEPLPWFEWQSQGGVGMYAGIKNGTPAVRLQARQELFSVKALHVQAMASVDQQISGPISADYFVGVGAEFRW